MSVTSRMTRTAVTVAAAGAAVLLGAGPAMAHHCFIPMYSLNGPASANWDVTTAEQAMGVPCDGAATAGYAALRANKLPVAIKVKVSMTIGDPKHTGRMNPNGANGKGLEYFGAGSPLIDQIEGTWTTAVEKFCAQS